MCACVKEKAGLNRQHCGNIIEPSEVVQIIVGQRKVASGEASCNEGRLVLLGYCHWLQTDQLKAVFVC